MNRQIGRTNFTLDADTAKLLKEHVDHLETELGFRPSLAQVVRGLILKARAGRPQEGEASRG